MLFDGNEKRIYATDDPERVLFHFKDVATAYNGIKKAVFPLKGVVNNRISSLIFGYLGSKESIPITSAAWTRGSSCAAGAASSLLR